MVHHSPVSFAFKVWRVPYVIGGIGLILMLSAAWQSMPLSYILTHLVLMILEWTAVSGMLFLLAWVTKFLSNKNPTLIFLLPVFISGISLFFFMAIFSIPRQGMGDLAFVVVLMMASVLLLPANISSWVCSLREYLKVKLLNS